MGIMFNVLFWRSKDSVATKLGIWKLLDSHFGDYDYLQFGSIADDIRDLPAQGPHPLEAVCVWARLGDLSRGSVRCECIFDCFHVAFVSSLWSSSRSTYNLHSWWGWACRQFSPSAQKIIVLGFWSHLCKWTLSRHEWFSEIKEGAVITDKRTGKSWGFGFFTCRFRLKYCGIISGRIRSITIPCENLNAPIGYQVRSYNP